jgi:uncharacterized protein (DUF58 family)
MVRPTFRVGLYGAIVLVGLTVALVTARPEAAIVVAPFAVFLAVGLALGPPPAIDVRVSVDRDHVVEGDVVTVTIRSATPDIDLAPMLAAALVPIGGRVAPGMRTLVLRAARWGRFDVGTMGARTFDPLRLWARETTMAAPIAVRVHPQLDRLRQAVTATKLQPFVGQHTSRARGDGFELAEVRPYAIGDRRGAVNWRASARRGSLWVNDRHPERTSDVVLLLDTFGTQRVERVDVLDHAVRALGALAQAYERTHDRVGLLTFGGHLRWLHPGSGRVNLVRIIDGMLDTERLLTDTWADTLRVPIGALPPGALLVAVSALDDDTALHTLLDLRGRGFDVAVLTVMPAPEGDVRTRRLDALLRDARQRTLSRFGIAVADLDGGVLPAVEELRAFRARAPRVPVR